MSETKSAPLTVAGLFAEREARRQRDREAAELLAQRKEEELAAFRQRLNNFELTEDRIHAFDSASAAPSNRARPS